MKPTDWIRHLEALGAPNPSDRPPDPTLLSGERGEQRLWRACLGEAPRTEILGDLLDDLLGELQAILGARRGALLSTDGFLAIEVWTECELAAVHALARCARHPDARIAAFSGDRVDEAVRWHLEHTQPDNATNRPWALHAFLLAEDGSGDPTAYAETLLHNMSATEARNEPLSRWILADCARELRLRGYGSA